VRALLVAASATVCALAPSVASAAPEKRAVPDYDGRGEEKTSATDVLLWPPRIVLFPIWVTHEYVIRKPIGALTTHAEKHHWPTRVADFFTWEKDGERKGGIVPTGYYEFGFRPSVGLYFWWNDVGFKGHDLRAHAGTWGPSWLSVAVAERFRLNNDRVTLAWGAEYIRRPDALFAGIGPRSLERDVARFGFTRVGFAPSLDVNLGGLSLFRASVGARSVTFRDDESCCGDPPIRDRVAEGAYPYPPGFRDGYTALHETLHLVLDSRKPGPKGTLQQPANATGVRASFNFEHAGDLRQPTARQWVRYGGHLGGFVDLDGHNRTLGLIVSADFADPIAGDIPFTEQVNLPYAATVPAGIVGIGPMRGFRPGRLIDRSALAATLQYTWPIWIWLDGAVHVAAGNVFGKHLREFEPDLLRFSGGIGFRTVDSPDHQFELLVATGTETIRDGMDLNRIRVYAGFTRGF